MGGAETFRVSEPDSDPRKGRFTVEVVAAGACFEGHFPGRPVLPAIAQLVLVERLWRRLVGDAPGVGGFEALRFVRPVAPGERIHVRIEAAPGERVWRFAVSGPDGPVSSGRLSARAGTAS